MSQQCYGPPANANGHVTSHVAFSGLPSFTSIVARTANKKHRWSCLIPLECPIMAHIQSSKSKTTMGHFSRGKAVATAQATESPAQPPQMKRQLFFPHKLKILLVTEKEALLELGNV